MNSINSILVVLILFFVCSTVLAQQTSIPKDQTLLFQALEYPRPNSRVYEVLNLDKSGNAYKVREVKDWASQAMKKANLDSEQVRSVNQMLNISYFQSSAPLITLNDKEKYTEITFFKGQDYSKFEYSGSLPDEVQKVIDFVKTQIIKQQRSIYTRSVEAQIENNRPSDDKIKVEFTGNKIFSSEILLSKLNQCLTKYPDSTKEESILNLRYCLQDINSLMWEKGYLRAKVGSSIMQQTNNELKAVVKVEEGIIYRLGDVEFKNNNAFSETRLLQMLKIKKGEPANGERIREWLQGDIKYAYANLGFIQSDAEVEMDFKPSPDIQSEGIVNLKVVIDEGEQFTVNKINFVGNETISEQFLRNKLIISENKLFNQQNLDLSIEILNNLNLFEPIDKDKDITITTDKESPLVNIKIRVKEKKK